MGKPALPAAKAPPTPADDATALAAAAIGMLVGVTGAVELLARRSDDRDEFERRKVLAIAATGLLIYGAAYVFELDKRWYDFESFREWAEQQTNARMP